MIPERLHNPTVGLIPTTPLIEAGQRIDPFVSVPIATAHRFAATAAPDPELDPHGFLSNAYGFLVCPPRLLHPLDERLERKLAHSLKLVLPSKTAPDSRNLEMMNASFEARFPSSAMDPAVVSI